MTIPNIDDIILEFFSSGNEFWCFSNRIFNHSVFIDNKRQDHILMIQWGKCSVFENQRWWVVFGIFSHCPYIGNTRGYLTHKIWYKRY